MVRRRGLTRVKGFVSALMVVALMMSFSLVSATAITVSGTIKGTVVDSSGDPLKDVRVSLMSPIHDNSEWDAVLTAADGTYEFPAADVGLYKVKFSRNDKVEKWYDDKPNFETAQSINLSANETLAGIDATLVAAGSIEGTLSAGPGVTDVRASVRLYDSSGYSAWWGGWDVDVDNPADPTFKFTNLAPGTYKIVVDPWDDDVLDQWYDGKDTFDSATGIVVVGEATATANMTLKLGATIKGTVTNGSDPLPAHLRIYDVNGNYFMSEDANGEGEYEFTGLPAGQYKVFAEKWDYVGEYYDNKPSLSSANMVTVAGTETVDGIDFVLEKGQKVKGKVVDASGKGLQYVEIFIDGETTRGVEFDRDTKTGSDGTYEFAGVPDGLYTVAFDPSLLNSANTTMAPATGFTREYYDDKVAAEAANRISVNSTTLAGIDATLAVGGAIKGMVRDGSGAPASGVDVSVLVKSGDEYWFVSSAYSNPDGTYEIKGLLPGSSYAVRFGDYNWYDGTTLPDQAKTVTVVAGQSTVVDGVFVGEIAALVGTVLGSDGKPAGGVKAIFARETAPGVFVEAPYDYDYASSDGRFYFFGGSGKVKIRFTDPQGRYLDAYYAGTSAADSKVVTLEAGKEVAVSQTLAFKSSDSAEGLDRFATSVAVSKRAFPRGSDSLIIATGRNWPDALGGAGLAGWAYGPILLVDKDSIPQVVQNEITRLANYEDIEDVYILGSEAVISKGVENQLLAMFDEPGVVQRLAGSTRYETAGKIADELIERAGDDFSGTALVATGLNYPDALAASPLAAAKYLPMFLLDSAGVTDAVANMMASKGITQVIILGSDKVVSKASADKLVAKFGQKNVVRLAGGTRYTTAIEVAKYGVSQGMSWQDVGFATGTNFPDALSGGVLQGMNNNVMLLTPGTSLDPAVETLIKEKKAEIFSVRFFGSTSAIGKAVRDRIAAIRK